MKKIVRIIIQVLLLVTSVTIFYVTYNKYIATDDRGEASYDSKIRMVLGKDHHTLKESNDAYTTLVYTDSKLVKDETIRAKYSVFGDTLVSSDNVNYFNNFVSVFVEKSDNSLKEYKATVDDRALNIILNDNITVVSTYATDDYYHAISKVKLQSTIDYDVDASVLTIIKDNKRQDIIIREDVDRVVYDEQNDCYYVFFTPTSDHRYTNSIIVTMQYQKLVWNEENKVYSAEEGTKNSAVNISSEGLLYADYKGEDVVELVYGKEFGYSDSREYFYYIVNYNLSTNEIINTANIAYKDVDIEESVKVLQVLRLQSHLYLFFDDLTYKRVSLADYSNEEFIISNTGIVKNISFDTDGENLYMLSSNDNSVNLFKIVDGNIVERDKMDKDEYDISFSRYRVLYDFAIRNVNKKEESE